MAILSEKLVGKSARISINGGTTIEGEIVFYTPDYDTPDYVPEIGVVTKTKQLVFAESEIASIEIIE